MGSSRRPRALSRKPTAWWGGQVDPAPQWGGQRVHRSTGGPHGWQRWPVGPFGGSAARGKGLNLLDYCKERGDCRVVRLLCIRISSERGAFPFTLVWSEREEDPTICLLRLKPNNFYCVSPKLKFWAIHRHIKSNIDH